MKDESIAQELDRRREDLISYYKALIEEDDAEINKIVKGRYPDNEELQKAFMDGYRFSLEQPMTRTIHLIVMYAYDYVNDTGINMKNVISKIRTLFRNKIVNL